jgi:hypothetical protein
MMCIAIVNLYMCVRLYGALAFWMPHLKENMWYIRRFIHVFAKVQQANYLLIDILSCGILVAFCGTLVDFRTCLVVPLNVLDC